MFRYSLLLLVVAILTFSTALGFNKISSSFKGKSAYNIKSKKATTSNVKSYKQAPTMVVYWSIKSTYDLILYAAGRSNTFQGTGVWSFIEFERESRNPQPDDDSSSQPIILPPTQRDLDQSESTTEKMSKSSSNKNSKNQR